MVGREAFDVGVECEWMRGGMGWGKGPSRC
jgi:hypothetical protein